MTQAEKMAMVRAEAVKQFVNFGEAEVFQIGVATFAVAVADGWAKVTVQAVKAEDFDAAAEAENFAFEQAQKKAAKEAKAAEKAAKVAAKAK